VNSKNQQQIVRFVFLAYLLSWSFWICAMHFRNRTIQVSVFSLHATASTSQAFSWMGNLGPGLAGILLVILARNRPEMKEFFHSFVRLRIPMRALGWAVSVPLVVIGPVFFMQDGRLSLSKTASLYVLETILNLPLAPLWEEIGWRGYLLPRLQASQNSLSASLLLGVIWAFWHLPLRLHTGPPDVAPWIFFVTFVIYVSGSAVIFTWLYNLSRGALLPVIVFHSALGSAIHLILDPVMITKGLRPLLLVCFTVWASALALIITNGRSLGKSRDLVATAGDQEIRR
jgi:membrane protease YdiL (CAAX protease family)